MTQRERHASGRAIVAAPRAPSGQASSPASVSSPEHRATQHVSWEELFQSVSGELRAELLNLAQRQGLLYADQLPSPNGPIPSTSSRPILSEILSGSEVKLPPLRISPLEALDTNLDSVQQEAVARAIQTPDLCLIIGAPGTGKSRVIAEIIRQAVRKEERVVLL